MGSEPTRQGAEPRRYLFEIQTLFWEHFGGMSEREKLAMRGIATPPDDRAGWELVDQQLEPNVNHVGQHTGTPRVRALWRREVLEDVDD